MLYLKLLVLFYIKILESISHWTEDSMIIIFVYCIKYKGHSIVNKTIVVDQKQFDKPTGKFQKYKLASLW